MEGDCPSCKTHQEELKKLQIDNKKLRLELKYIRQEQGTFKDEQKKLLEEIRAQQKELQREKEAWMRDMHGYAQERMQKGAWMRDSHQMKEPESCDAKELESINKIDQENRQTVTEDEKKSTTMTPSTAASSSNSTTATPSNMCTVCGEVANGMHYNALTCEGCKIFFRRHCRKKEMLKKCGMHVDTKDCMMDSNMRKQCSYCRMKKCLQVGMSTERVWDKDRCKTRKSVKKSAGSSKQMALTEDQSPPQQLPSSTQTVPSTSTSSSMLATSSAASSSMSASNSATSSSLPASNSSASSSMSESNRSASSSMSASDSSADKSVVGSHNVADEEFPSNPTDLLQHIYNMYQKAIEVVITANKTRTTLEEIRTSMSLAAINSVPSQNESTPTGNTQISMETDEEASGPKRVKQTGAAASSACMEEDTEAQSWRPVNEALNQHFMETILLYLKHLICFAKSLSFFRGLPSDDQAVLIKEAFVEYMLLMVCIHHIPGTELCGNPLVPGETMSIAAGCAGGFSLVMANIVPFSDKLIKLQLSKEEHSTLLAICIFTSDRSGLSEEAKQVIGPFNEQLIEAFCTSTKEIHPKEPYFFAKVVSILTELRSCTEDFMSQLMQLKVNGRNIQPLLGEVLNLE